VAPSHDKEAIYREVEAYYAGKLREHGATPRGVDWADAAGHRLRHEQFLHLLDRDLAASVADLGCGYGDFLKFLRATGFRGPYVGYDLAQSMLDEAQRIHGLGPDRHWRRAAVPLSEADYVIASGIFNVRRHVDTKSWLQYILDTIDAMGAMARKGLAFNLLTAHSDPERMRQDLYYGDPAFFLDHCARRFGRRVGLVQDYGLYEFTLWVRKG
jgi:SAM-dependent methyltransferase